MMASETLFAGRAPRRWIRLEQHRDKAPLSLAPETFDGLILNANLVEHSAASLASFVDGVAKPFVVDPMSHRFSRSEWFIQERDGIATNRRNYSKLWDAYANGVDSLSRDPMVDFGRLPGLSDQDLVRFCENVVSFQENRLRQAWANEATRFVDIESFWGPILSPMAYVAPYVVLGEGDPWSEIQHAVRLARCTAALGRSKPIAVILPVMEPCLRDFDLMRHLAVSIGDSGANAAFVWPVKLSELQLADDPARFTGLRLLIQTLTDAGVQAASLYGGYLSGLMKEFGSEGISHCLLYGQSRGLDPTGGRPACIHYFRPLRQLVPFGTALEIVTGMSPDTYIDKICSCEVCHALIERDGTVDAYFRSYIPTRATRPIPTAEALALNQVHFLHAQGMDLANLRTSATVVAIRDLLAAADRYSLGSVTTPARRWAERLRAA